MIQTTSATALLHTIKVMQEASWTPPVQTNPCPCLKRIKIRFPTTAQKQHSAIVAVAPTEPSSSTIRQAVRPTTSPTQKLNINSRQREERGPKLAFGGRDSVTKQGRQIHDSPKVNAAIMMEGPVGKKVTKARLAVTKPDPWLADWQPKPRLQNQVGSVKHLPQSSKPALAFRP